MTDIECVLLVYGYPSTQGGYICASGGFDSTARLSLHAGRVSRSWSPRRLKIAVIPPRKEGIVVFKPKMEYRNLIFCNL